uniref:Triacylglycerol lipase n=1 Tax=Panagrolaimus sp. JU765 TaxID=591449 RepID=A0AC34PZC2_9BILA
MLLELFLTLLATNQVLGDFTEDFGSWLQEHYGPDVRANLERKDLGTAGSFGGKGSRGEALDKHPVIFVHGVSDRAHDKPLRAAEFFLKNGYSLAEVYGTTYANGAEGNPLQWAQYSMKCHYVKLVRALIVAVRMYTGRAVDVVSYSLGVPVTRKAILGGRCVDTGEDLGGPLTRIIDTFVGVVYGTTYANGAEGNPLQWAQYSMKCHYVKLVRALIVAVRMYTGRAVDVVSYSLGVPVTRKAILGGRCVDTGEDLGGPLTRIIDTFVGVDINRQAGYEATSQRFSIYSRADQLVGYQVCNRITTQVPGQTGEKVYADKNHDNTWYESYAVMKEMVLNHVVI